MEKKKDSEDTKKSPGFWSRFGDSFKNFFYGNDEADMQELATDDEGRDKEPEPFKEEDKKSLGSKLSGLVGKDIVSMISLPVWIFEPLTFLQLMAECLEFTNMLDYAADADDEFIALGYIAAFHVATRSRAIRPRKPFNPILGETFEVCPSDKSFRFISEQISHHPPIAVSSTRSKLWDISLEASMQSKFKGNSAEVIIPSINYLRFKERDWVISFNYVKAAANNILIGRLWIDNFGDFVATNLSTGSRVELRFEKAGMFGSNRYVLNGKILDKNNNPVYTLSGKWNSHLNGIHVETKEKRNFWEAEPTELDPKWKHSTYIRNILLDAVGNYEKIIPETDSRIRKDRKLLQIGDTDKAGEVKHQLEEAQRAEERERIANNEEWEYKYFKKMEGSVNGETYSYWVDKPDYWIERKKHVAEVFGEKIPPDVPMPSSEFEEKTKKKKKLKKVTSTATPDSPVGEGVYKKKKKVSTSTSPVQNDDDEGEEKKEKKKKKKTRVEYEENNEDEV